MAKLLPVNTKYIIAAKGETLIGDGISCFPDTTEIGDKFRTIDYEYVSLEKGWGLVVRDKEKTYYQPILGKINGVETVSMEQTFLDCCKLKVAPDIPQSVVYMSLAFDGCEQLVEVPKIPDGVVSLRGTFAGCKSLTTAPEIPNSVTDLAWAFKGCTALEGILICHADPKTIKCALRGTQITEIEGSCSEKTRQNLMKTKK